MLQTCSNWFPGTKLNWIIQNVGVQGYVYHQTLIALTYMHRLLQFDSVPQAVYHIKARETHFKMFSFTFV